MNQCNLLSLVRCKICFQSAWHCILNRIKRNINLSDWFDYILIYDLSLTVVIENWIKCLFILCINIYFNCFHENKIHLKFWILTISLYVFTDKQTQLVAKRKDRNKSQHGWTQWLHLACRDSHTNPVHSCPLSAHIRLCREMIISHLIGAVPKQM